VAEDLKHNPRRISEREMWDAIFATPDPWNYHSQYEQEKYRRTLSLFPVQDIEDALESGLSQEADCTSIAPVPCCNLEARASVWPIAGVSRAFRSSLLECEPFSIGIRASFALGVQVPRYYPRFLYS
jgi:hypothetical protein